jgi:archaemetzincin
MEVAGPGDWLSVNAERGQSLGEYLATSRAAPTPARGALVLVTIGAPSPAQQRILARTARYLAAGFGLPVRFASTLSLADVPAGSRREERGFGPQVNTRWLLDSLLVARRAPDASLEVGLSALDLYPQESWNFVFGQALPAQGVGVWSMARFGEPDARPPTGPWCSRARSARRATKSGTCSGWRIARPGAAS